MNINRIDIRIFQRGAIFTVIRSYIYLYPSSSINSPTVISNLFYFIQVLSPVSLHLSKKQPVSSIWSYLSQVIHSGFQSLLFWIGSQSASRMPFQIASSLSSISIQFCTCPLVLQEPVPFQLIHENQSNEKEANQ